MLDGTADKPALISDFKEYHTDQFVKFIIKMNSDKLRRAEQEGLHKVFKLQSCIVTTSMVILFFFFIQFYYFFRCCLMHLVVYDVLIHLKKFVRNFLKLEKNYILNVNAG